MMKGYPQPFMTVFDGAPRLDHYCIRRLPIQPTPKSAGFKLNKFGILPYRSGDRCGFCGGAGFYIGRTTAQCSNPRCDNVMALERS